MSDVVILADPSGKGYEFARKVYEYVSAKRGRDFPVSLVDLKKTVFKDGEFKIKIAENVRGHSCFYIHDSNKLASEWISDLLLVLKAAASSSPCKLTVVLPYMRFARQDRKDESRVSVSSKAICDVMALYAQGALSIDLHAPQIQEYPQSRFSFDNLSSAPVVADHLEKGHREILDNLTLVSPDLGGGKRLEVYQKALRKRGIEAEIALGHKTRLRDNEVEYVEIIGNVSGRNCLIVDDIIDTGGTMVETARMLKEKGAISVIGFGTFGLFTNGVGEFREFDEVMTGDALDTSNLVGVEVVSLVELFGEAIYRSHVGDSLSSLFE